MDRSWELPSIAFVIDVGCLPDSKLMKEKKLTCLGIVVLFWGVKMPTSRSCALICGNPSNLSVLLLAIFHPIPAELTDVVHFILIFMVYSPLSI